MQTDATPDPAFLEGLEWQLRRELRRGSRFDRRSDGRVRRAAMLGVLVLGSGLTGMVGMGAAQHVQAARRAEPVVLALEARDKAAARVRESAMATRAAAQASHQAGATSSEHLASAEARLAEAEALASKAALDLEEAKLSNQSPRDDLSAPRVNGRDFVSERLKATLTGRAKLLALAETSLEKARALHRAGAISTGGVASAQLGKDLAEIDVRETSARIAAREQFLAGKASASEAERAGLRVSADHRVLRAEARTGVVRQRRDAIKQLRAAGGAGSDELSQAEDLLADAEWELSTARAEAAALEDGTATHR